MDPELVTTKDWADISTPLRFLWAYWVFIIGFAFTLLLAHAIVPSLVSTRQLPAGIARLRPMLYLGGIGILTIAVIFLVLTWANIGFIGRLWDRWWI